MPQGCLQHRHRPPMLQQVGSHLFVESPQLLPVLQRGGLAGALPQDEVLQRLQLQTTPKDALQASKATICQQNIDAASSIRNTAEEQ